MEGQRTRTSDEALRPAVSISRADELHCELTDLIARLGRIHEENEELHNGRYQELMLTNRQYAFARIGEQETVIVMVNNDEQEAQVSVPLPTAASQIVNLETEEIVEPENGKVTVTLMAGGSALLLLK